MLISITAPSKGLGQSVTAINLATMISILINKKTLIVDINKYCKDISFYLSDSVLTKGLDDFKNLLNADMLSDKLVLNSCVKNINEKLDIMDSNECSKFSREEINCLIEYTDRYYPATVVDTISGENELTQILLEKSNAIVIVLNQYSNSISKVLNNPIYKKHREKIIFVVNRFLESVNNEKIKYSFNEILKELNVLEIKRNKIFKLNFDVELMNNCNDNAILNYVLNNKEFNKKYLEQLREISEFVLDSHDSIGIVESAITSENNTISLIKKIFSLFYNGREINAEIQ